MFHFLKKLQNYWQHFVLSQFILTVLIPHHSLNLQFLVASDVEHFFYAYLPIMYPLW